MRKVATRIGVALLLGYAVVGGLAYAFQQQLVFPALAPGRMPQVADRYYRPAGLVPMLWLPPPSNDAPVVVYFHGNGEQIADGEGVAASFAEAGLGVLMVEYPGYGLAADAGSPSEPSVIAAARAAVVHLRDVLNVPKERTVLVGRSLGSGVAVALGEEGLAARVVLLSPYTALVDVGARRYPFLPVKAMMRDRFDSLSRAKDVAVPVLCLHGNRDQVVDFDLGQTLCATFPSSKLIELDGIGHDVYSSPQVLPAVIAFANGEP